MKLAGCFKGYKDLLPKRFISIHNPIKVSFNNDFSKKSDVILTYQTYLHLYLHQRDVHSI